MDSLTKPFKPFNAPLARRALRGNAIFSLATGLLLALAPATVGGWLGVSIDGWLRLLGLALIGHCGILLWAAVQPNLRQLTTLNLLAVAPYPLLMIALVVGGVIDRSLGQVLALLDGAVVGALAAAQWASLRGPAIAAHPQAA